MTWEAEFEADLQQRVFLASLEPQLAAKIAAVARKHGISTETFINVWLTEKVEEAGTNR